MAKRIAIIGSGASGLTAIKCCLDEGLTPVCFERSDQVGGLWRYTPKVTDGQSCVMKSTVINTSKEIMTYSDFPIPAEFPVFMHNTKVQQYLEMYGEHFDSKKYTQFNTEVTKVKQADKFEETGQWELTIKSGDGSIRMEVFDGVMVCTGHHAEKNVPQFEGLDTFKGTVVHTHDYRDHVGYENKNVLIIGIGNSGGDVAVELSRISKQVYLSTRRGSWVLNRISDYGYPADLLLIKRVVEFVKAIVPRSWYNKFAEIKLNNRFNHENFGLKPEHQFDSQHPMVNDEFPNRIACGTLKVKPDIRRFTLNGVEFVDGSVVENIDVVILATGFKFGFPFVDHSALEVKNNDVNLYKYVFPPDIQPSTLAVIGCIQPVGAIMPISEMQCRWAARVFNVSVFISFSERFCSCTIMQNLLQKAAYLPTKHEMWLEVKKKKAEMAERYVRSQRHTIQVDYIPYMDEMAERFGCKPDIGKLFWEDPRLAFKCFFGPFTPYQYRLQGPGRWSGARQAVMTVWDRTLAGTKPPTATSNSTGSLLLYAVAFIIFAIFIKWFIF